MTTAPGSKWVCHHCAFVTEDMDRALKHPWATAETFSHWLYEHEGGWRTKPPTREIHSSDAGGCYVTAISPVEAAADVRRWRERARG